MGEFKFDEGTRKALFNYYYNELYTSKAKRVPTCETFKAFCKYATTLPQLVDADETTLAALFNAARGRSALYAPQSVEVGRERACNRLVDLTEQVYNNINTILWVGFNQLKSYKYTYDDGKGYPLYYLDSEINKTLGGLKLLARLGMVHMHEKHVNDDPNARVSYRVFKRVR